MFGVAFLYSKPKAGGRGKATKKELREGGEGGGKEGMRDDELNERERVCEVEKKRKRDR